MARLASLEEALFPVEERPVLSRVVAVADVIG